MDTPVGELTLVASARGCARCCGRTNAHGRVPVAEADGCRCRGRRDPRATRSRQLGEYFAGERTEFDLPARPGRHRVPAAGVAGAAHDPVRRDDLLRRAGPPARRPEQVAGRRRGERPQPDQHHRARATAWSAATASSPASPVASTTRPGCSHTSSQRHNCFPSELRFGGQRLGGLGCCSRRARASACFFSLAALRFAFSSVIGLGSGQQHGLSERPPAGSASVSSCFSTRVSIADGGGLAGHRAWRASAGWRRCRTPR